jgi:hypothetical protein
MSLIYKSKLIFNHFCSRRTPFLDKHRFSTDIGSYGTQNRNKNVTKYIDYKVVVCDHRHYSEDFETEVANYMKKGYIPLEFKHNYRDGKLFQTLALPDPNYSA